MILYFLEMFHPMLVVMMSVERVVDLEEPRREQILDVRRRLRQLEINRDMSVYRSLIDDTDDAIVRLIEGDVPNYRLDSVFEAVKREVRFPDGEMRGFVGDVLYIIWAHRSIGMPRSLAIAELFIERFKVTDEAGEFKITIGRETYDPAREERHTADLCSKYPDREKVIRDLYYFVYEYSRFKQDANRGFS